MNNNMNMNASLSHVVHAWQKKKKKLMILYFNGLTTGKNEKEYSWHVPARKFIGMKQLV